MTQNGVEKGEREKKRERERDETERQIKALLLYKCSPKNKGLIQRL